jgi:hypothetical protein
MNLEHKIKLTLRIFIKWSYIKKMQVLFEELGIEDILTSHPRFYNKFSRAHIKSKRL